MFDPESVRRDMDRIFHRPRRPAPHDAASGVKILPVRESSLVTPQSAPARRTRVGRRIAMVGAGLLLLPALALAISYAMAVWKPFAPPKEAVLPIAAPSAHGRKPAPIAPVRPASQAAPSRQGATAFMVVEQPPTSWRAAPRRNYRRLRRSGVGSKRGGSALEAEVAADSMITQRLNQAEIEVVHPTLGYSPSVAEQAAPK